MMRIAFMGTPEFAVPTLEALADAHEIAAVYTQPPRPAGRGKRPRPTPTAKRAAELGFEIRTPPNFRDPAERAAFAALGLDAAVVVAYGLLLPVEILEAPVHGCFNLHASLLPRWRGAAPIQRAVMAGDVETGVSIMKMDAGLDTGPVALTATTPIRESDTASTLHDRLAALGAPLMVEALAHLEARELKLTAQPAEGVYAAKIEKSETRIDWRRASEHVDRQIRGLSRFPGAWFMVDGERVKALMANQVPGSGAPGETLDDQLTVACGSGAVRLTRLQRAGGAPMEATAFLRGRPVAAGVTLEGA